MSYQTITISYANGAVSCTSDPAPAQGDFSAPVEANHHVSWVAGDGVQSIKSITLDPNPGIFSEIPTTSNNGQSWVGMVAVGATPGETDSYSGVVVVSGENVPFDPKLKVDQTPPPPVLK